MKIRWGDVKLAGMQARGAGAQVARKVTGRCVSRSFVVDKGGSRRMV